MHYSDVVTLVGNVGFPIAVTVYVLTRLEAKMENLNQSITELAHAIKEQRAD